MLVLKKSEEQKEANVNERVETFESATISDKNLSTRARKNLKLSRMIRLAF
jgi:hypothetical protein